MWQAREEECIHIQASMGSGVQIAFYHTSPQELASVHPVVEALLGIKTTMRNGCYSVPTERLANAAGMAPSEVSRSMRVPA